MWWYTRGPSRRDLTAEAARWRRLAETDPLTGLMNLRGADAAITEKLDRTGWVGLAVVDLDHFKRVNDTHGHAAGNAVLCEVGQRLLHAVRPADLVARTGGDEFGVVLGDRSPVGDGVLAEWAARLAEAIAGPVELPDGQIWTVRASVGAAIASVSEMESVWEQADSRMYAAKRGRRAVAA